MDVVLVDQVTFVPIFLLRLPLFQYFCKRLKRLKLMMTNKNKVIKT